MSYCCHMSHFPGNNSIYRVEMLPGKAHWHVGIILVCMPTAGVKQMCAGSFNQKCEKGQMQGPAMSNLHPRQDTTGSGAVRLLGERSEGLLPSCDPSPCPRIRLLKPVRHATSSTSMQRY